jgi:hypothetical protein
MISALIKQDNEDIDNEKTRRALASEKEILDLIEKGTEHFVSPATKEIFHRFNLNTRFFQSHPSSWSGNDDFQKGLEIVKKLKVVNDSAERGVKLMEHYQNCVTKNENRKQFILKITSDYRCRFPNAEKSTTSKRL